MIITIKRKVKVLVDDAYKVGEKPITTLVAIPPNHKIDKINPFPPQCNKTKIGNKKYYEKLYGNRYNDIYVKDGTICNI